MSSPQDPENGGLFPIEEVLPPVPDDRETDLSTVERAQHIVEALNYFDSVAGVETLLRKFNNPEWKSVQQQRLGKSGFYAWQSRKYAEHQELLDGAKAEFMQAYTIEDFMRTGLSAEEAQGQLDRDYSLFKEYYSGTSQASKRKRQHVREEYQRYITASVLHEEQEIVEAPVFPAEDPSARVSLARALRPEFARLNQADYADITVEEIRELHPSYLSTSLVKVPSGTRNARHHIDETTHRRLYTVFMPGEWKTLLRTNPDDVAVAAFNETENAQRKLPVEERDSMASSRAEAHVNRGYAERMQKYVTKDLDVTLDVLARFEEAANFNAGLARFGNEANMRANMEFFWETVADMVWATRIANGLEPGWEDRAMRVFEKRVYFAGTPAARLTCFTGLLDAAKEWVSARRDHMLAKSHEANDYADKKEKEVAFRVGQNLRLSS